MVSQKAGSPGRTRISRNAIAQGRPDASAKPVCSCAAFLLHLSHMRPRVRRAPGLPCALCFSGATNAKLRADHAARTISAVFVRVARNRALGRAIQYSRAVTDRIDGPLPD